MAVLSVFLGPLQSLLNSFQSERHYQDDKKDDALRAIQRALLESKKYIELSAGVVDRDKEYELTELWSEASIKARYASKELGILLKGKSEYWADSIVWSHEEVVEKGIDFDSIDKQINDLLGNP